MAHGVPISLFRKDAGRPVPSLPKSVVVRPAHHHCLYLPRHVLRAPCSVPFLHPRPDHDRPRHRISNQPRLEHRCNGDAADCVGGGLQVRALAAHKSTTSLMHSQAVSGAIAAERARRVGDGADSLSWDVRLCMGAQGRCPRRASRPELSALRSNQLSRHPRIPILSTRCCAAGAPIPPRPRPPHARARPRGKCLHRVRHSLPAEHDYKLLHVLLPRRYGVYDGQEKAPLFERVLRVASTRFTPGERGSGGGR